MGTPVEQQTSGQGHPPEDAAGGASAPPAPDSAAPAETPEARPGFIAELKRRKILRAAVAYGVAASGIVQGLRAAADVYDLPSGVVRIVPILLVVGFPVNLLVAWFFDIAPLKPGEERQGHPRTGHGLFAARNLLKKPTWLAIGVMGVLVLGLSLGLTWFVTRPATSGPPKVRTVLVADFDNRTGETIFDRTLESAFTLALEGASFITSYSRPAALKAADQMKLPGSGLSEKHARLVASREGISVVMAGTIDPADDGYTVEVRAIDALTGKIIVKASRSAKSKQAVLAAISKVAARVREALGDRTPTSVQLAAGETFSASSLEAAHEYAIANNAQLAGHWDEAVKRYLEAIRLDPGLGRAYSGLAVIEGNRGHRAESARYFKLAMANVGRMTEREKNRSLGAYYLITDRDPDKAIQALTDLVKAYPADNTGLANLAVAYQLRRDFAKALEVARQAIAIYPNNVGQRNNVGLFSTYLGDFSMAIQEHQKVLELAPFVTGYQGLALAQLASGQRDAAIATWTKLQGLGAEGASLAAEGLADLALSEGRLSDAQALLEKGIEADGAAKDDDAAGRKLAMLGEVHLARGDLKSTVADALRARHANDNEYVTFLAGRLLAEAGEERQALEVANDLDLRLPTEPHLYADLVRGDVDLHARRYPAAIKHFRDATQKLDAWIAHAALGRAYLEAGAFIEAQEALSRCEKRRGEATDVFLDVVPTYRMYPPVLYELGRALEGVQSADASSWYRKFLATTRGDESPLVADAKRRVGPGPR